MTKRLPLNHPKRHITVEETAQIIYLRRHGFVVDQIAEMYGRDPKTISRLLVRNNCQSIHPRYIRRRQKIKENEQDSYSR